MGIVSDDYNAVDATRVSAVLKPDQVENWSLSLVVDGVTLQLRFTSTDARDSFYKQLVSAMGR